MFRFAFVLVAVVAVLWGPRVWATPDVSTAWRVSYVAPGVDVRVVCTTLVPRWADQTMADIIGLDLWSPALLDVPGWPGRWDRFRDAVLQPLSRDCADDDWSSLLSGLPRSSMTADDALGLLTVVRRGPGLIPFRLMVRWDLRSGDAALPWALDAGPGLVSDFVDVPPLVQGRRRVPGDVALSSIQWEHWHSPWPGRWSARRGPWNVAGWWRDHVELGLPLAPVAAATVSAPNGRLVVAFGDPDAPDDDPGFCGGCENDGPSNDPDDDEDDTPPDPWDGYDPSHSTFHNDPAGMGTPDFPGNNPKGRPDPSPPSHFPGEGEGNSGSGSGSGPSLTPLPRWNSTPALPEEGDEYRSDVSGDYSRFRQPFGAFDGLRWASCHLRLNGDGDARGFVQGEPYWRIGVDRFFRQTESEPPLVGATHTDRTGWVSDPLPVHQDMALRDDTILVMSGSWLTKDALAADDGTDNPIADQLVPGSTPPAWPAQVADAPRRFRVFARGHGPDDPTWTGRWRGETVLRSMADADDLCAGGDCRVRLGTHVGAAWTALGATSPVARGVEVLAPMQLTSAFVRMGVTAIRCTSGGCSVVNDDRTHAHRPAPAPGRATGLRLVRVPTVNYYVLLPDGADTTSASVLPDCRYGGVPESSVAMDGGYHSLAGADELPADASGMNDGDPKASRFDQGFTGNDGAPVDWASISRSLTSAQKGYPAGIFAYGGRELTHAKGRWHQRPTVSDQLCPQFNGHWQRACLQHRAVTDVGSHSVDFPCVPVPGAAGKLGLGDALSCPTGECATSSSDFMAYATGYQYSAHIKVATVSATASQAFNSSHNVCAAADALSYPGVPQAYHESVRYVASTDDDQLARDEWGHELDLSPTGRLRISADVRDRARYAFPTTNTSSSTAGGLGSRAATVVSGFSFGPLTSSPRGYSCSSVDYVPGVRVLTPDAYPWAERTAVSSADLAALDRGELFFSVPNANVAARAQLVCGNRKAMGYLKGVNWQPGDPPCYAVHGSSTVGLAHRFDPSVRTVSTADHYGVPRSVTRYTNHFRSVTELVNAPKWCVEDTAGPHYRGSTVISVGDQDFFVTTVSYHPYYIYDDRRVAVAEDGAGSQLRVNGQCLRALESVHDGLCDDAITGEQWEALRASEGDVPVVGEDEAGDGAVVDE